jgi:hypothetical protein
MGLFSKRIDSAYASRPSVPTMPVTPWDDQSALQAALISDLFGTDTTAVTRDIALRVPGLKRAVQIHADIVSAMPLVLYRDGVKVEPQPGWLQNSNSGIPPLIRTKVLVTDLALEGHALLGCEVTTENTITDAVAIPKTHWQFTADGVVEFTRLVDPRYLGKLILISLGTNGILTDAVDTIRQARALDIARTTRLASPPASTELHVTDPAYNDMTPAEQMKTVTAYAEQRQKTSVSFTPQYLEVKEHGAEPVDLFDSATNSLRLDIANHASVPASVIEGARASGGGSDMTYTGKGDERSELYDLGSRQFADAITARLSLDDVCAPGDYIAFDRSEMFAVPTPTTPQVLED